MTVETLAARLVEALDFPLGDMVAALRPATLVASSALTAVRPNPEGTAVREAVRSDRFFSDPVGDAERESDRLSASPDRMSTSSPSSLISFVDEWFKQVGIRKILAAWSYLRSFGRSPLPRERP